MNKQRALPLFFVLAFSLCVPVLAGVPGSSTQTPPEMSRLLMRANLAATQAWNAWHTRNQAYAELVSIVQK
jgi:hypothetical protein